VRADTLTVEQASHEAMHARRQYDAVDPDNRLVAGELEQRCNERLANGDGGLSGDEVQAKQVLDVHQRDLSLLLTKPAPPSPPAHV